MFWNICEFVNYSTGNRLWFYLSLIGSAMIPPFMFHFVITLVKPEYKNTVWLVPAYFFSGILALISPFAFFLPEIQKFVDEALWDICYFVLLTPFFFIGLTMLVNALKKAVTEDEKSRLRYIILAGIIGVFTALTDHVQTLNVPVPPLGHFGSVFYPSILAIGVFKHYKAYDILAQTRMKLEILNEMSAGIAHEIRNPLTSIKGASKLLADKLKNNDNPEDHEYLNIVNEEIERLNNILVNFQNFTRPLKIEKELVSINELIQKTVKFAEIDTLNIRIRQDLYRDLQMVQADASHMKQVFLNLIKNSAEACDPDGELVIKTEYISPWVKISFSDNGPGIPGELINQIFEPFFTTKPSGIGMGLAICQKIIQTHNGRIEANNILPKGTQFSILLPVLQN